MKQNVADPYVDELQEQIDQGEIDITKAQRNAIEHSFFTALVASNRFAGMSFGLAMVFSTAHEYNNRYYDGYPAYQSVSDLHNNHVGGGTVHTIGDGLPDEDAIKADLFNKLHSGLLWIDGEDRDDFKGVRQSPTANNKGREVW